MRSIGLRFFLVGFLALLMFIPLLYVGEIVGDRASYNRDTARSISQEWGGAQLISGPRLIIPVKGPVTRIAERKVTDPVTSKVTTEQYEVTEIRRKSAIYVYPDRFDVVLETATSERKRGIFEVPVYSAKAVIEGDFDLGDVQASVAADETILWDETTLDVSLSSNRALRGEARLEIDGQEHALEPLANAGHGTGGIFARIGNPRGTGDFSLTLGFNGAQSLSVAPVGRTSRVSIVSDWAHPSFHGTFLPDRSEISEVGFSADWTIPHLARALPQTSRSDYEDQARQNASFGVRFYQPNDFYQKAYRAGRYGILFIALTFLTVLLIEDRSGRPAHPVQYILIGLAQTVFVLLMVSYAEQIGFGAAYALASGATIGLLTLFGLTALKLGRRTWVLSIMLIVLYLVLYFILRSTDYALLAGSTLAFAALAGTMFFTRNEEWYGPKRTGNRFAGLFGRKPPPEPAPQQ